MLVNALILFFVAFVPALLVYFTSAKGTENFKFILSFSGAYLFSITVIHILPEAVTESGDFKLAGVYVLIGYFLQMLIEYFSTGVEHGHIHLHDDHKGTQKYFILLAMCVHGLLEGTLLMHPSHAHEEGDADTLLIGLVLHKLPEAFALAAVLIGLMKHRVSLFGWQLVFALASPVGLFVSDYLSDAGILDAEAMGLLFALLAGNFLYISTTIFFESNPQHKFKASRLAMSIFGAVTAVVVEYVLA
jgi:zinc transporter ZupT